MEPEHSKTPPSLSAALTRGIVLVAVLLVSLAVLEADPALAHSYLVRSDPPASAVVEVAPSELRLWFSEPPEPLFTQVRILDSSGNLMGKLGNLRRDPSDATLIRASAQDLPPGVLTVTWRTTTSVDGHVESGSFAFTVGHEHATDRAAPLSYEAADGGPSALEVVIKWTGYIGMSLLAGGLAFLVIVLRPVLGKVAWPADSPWAALAETAQTRVRLLAALGWVLTFASTLIGAVVEAASSAGVSYASAAGLPLRTLLGQTRYGTMFWARLLLLAVLWALLLYGARRRRSDRVPSREVVVALGVSLLLLLTSALGSHAAASAYPIATVLGDWVHLAAAAFWVGGLISLPVVLVSFRRTAGLKADYLAASTVAGFSFVAAICVLALGVSGLLQSTAQLANWQDLIDTPYGTTLLVKLGLLVPLLGLAAMNRRAVGRLSSSPDGESGAQRTRPWTGHILRNATGEIVFVALVLLATSVLTSSPPARETLGDGIVLRGQQDDLRAVLVASPGSPGNNRFEIYLKSRWVIPVTDAEEVALIFSSRDEGTGQTEAALSSFGDGRYVVQGSYIPTVSTWDIELLVRRPGQEDVRVRFTIQPSQLAGEYSDHEHSEED